MVAAEEPQPQPQLKYQTWVLKVPIHCEGCKRKVKKVLQSIEAVYTTDVDTQQHKVTVTGNVDAETLIRKLLKSGKHAELWPDKKAKKQSKSSDKAAKGGKEATCGGGSSDGGVSDTSDEGPDDGGGGGQKSHAKRGETVQLDKKGGDHPTKEVAPSKPETPAPNPVSPRPDKESNLDIDAAKEKAPGGVQGSGSSAGKKKKKKKKGNVSFGGHGGGGVVEASGDGKSGGPASGYAPPARNCSPTRQQSCPYPAQLAPQIQHVPVYGVSYSTSQPSASYAASYCATPAVAYGGAYVQPASRYSSESFHIFSDENANACSVM